MDHCLGCNPRGRLLRGSLPSVWTDRTAPTTADARHRVCPVGHQDRQPASEVQGDPVMRLVMGLALLALLLGGCAPATCADFAKRELKEHGRVVVWCAK